MWYLYVLRCGDGSFYTGITTDVARRLREHQAGRGAHYTRTHLPVELVAAWRYPDQSTATRVEYQFKQLPHGAKAAWVEGRWTFMGGPFAFEALGDTAPAARFCPRCGSPLPLLPEGVDSEVRPACECCDRPYRTCMRPVVGVLILRGEEVLLVRRNRAPFEGCWDVPGGFLRSVEDLEEAALRRSRAETGLTVSLHAFSGGYVDQCVFEGERHAILALYFVAEGEGAPRPGEDVEEMGWFPLTALPTPLAFAHLPRVLADLRRDQGLGVHD
ncbi:MAG: NUDIX domain-containing protein [Anaerolineae bacterium]